MPEFSLEVTSYRCASCGYQWTHSYARHLPPPDPSFPGKGPLIPLPPGPSIFTQIYSYPGTFQQPGCIRCVPNSLPPNWQEAALQRNAAIRARSNMEAVAAVRPAKAPSKYKDMDLDDLLE